MYNYLSQKMAMDYKIRDDAYVVAKTGNLHDPVYDIRTHKNQSKSTRQEMLINGIAMSNHPIHITLLRMDCRLSK